MKNGKQLLSSKVHEVSVKVKYETYDQRTKKYTDPK